MHYWKDKIKDARELLFSRAFLFAVLGFVLLFAVWQVLAVFMHAIVIASPVDTFTAVWEMIKEERLQKHVWITMRRMFSGIFIGSIAGFILGIWAGVYENIKNLFEPLRWTLMSISPVVVVVIAMLWFGMGSTMVVFIAAVLLAPVVYVNTTKGMEMVDENIIEMAETYRLSFFQKLRFVYIPALAGPLSAAMTIVVSAGARMVVLAEVLGTTEGIGYALSLARTNLEIPELFGWVVVSVTIVGSVEYMIFRPIQDYVLRWQRK